MKEITDVLMILQKGYEDKNPKYASTLFTKIFSNRQDLLILGTGSWEICLGRDEATKLIYDDWNGGWGDFKIDIDGAKIEVDGECAWFYADCTVKYSFQDSDDAEYKSYVDFVKSITDNQNATPKQKLAFLNWALGIHFHERKPGKRDYFWASELSGMLVKENDMWKISSLHFAITKPNYPDERFEEIVNDYHEGYNHTKNRILSHNGNKVDDKLLHLLKRLENEMSDNSESHGLHFDPEQILMFDAGRFAWVMALGMEKQSISESEIFDRSLQEIEELLQIDLMPEDKLFQIKRNITYAIKEAASGTEYTWPIRLTAIVEKSEDDYRFRHKHFSYPFYWIFEGKH